MKPQPNLPKIFHLRFAPEIWSPLFRLCNFVGLAFPNNRDAYDGLTACEGHLDKVQVLKRIAERLLPELPKDLEELDQRGASRNLNSHEYAALCETIICELYSSLDGLRQFLYGIYRHVRKVQNSSNEKLFRHAKEQVYGPEFSEAIRLELAQAYDTWFPRLRTLRTELTHGKVGSCHLDSQTGKVRYFNDGLGNQRRVFVIEDVVAVLNEYETYVTRLLNAIAAQSFEQVEKKPYFQICGIYLGRIYARMVSPSVNMTFQDGHCASWDWFEQEKAFMCPMISRCSAYKSKWPGGSKAALGV